MDVRQKIAKQVDRLPPRDQQVLHFAASLAGSERDGDDGTNYQQYAGFFDAQSLREMTEIEEEFGRIDARI